MLISRWGGFRSNVRNLVQHLNQSINASDICDMNCFLRGPLSSLTCFNLRPKGVFERVPALFHTSPSLSHGDYEWEEPKSKEDIVNITYIDKQGKETKVRGKIGDNVLYLAHRYGIAMEGACEASLACTTCHCYVDDSYVSKLPEALEKEEDLLDLAPFLKENSRLGCQIILKKDLEGMTLTLPKATRNFYVDGHTPKPH